MTGKMEKKIKSRGVKDFRVSWKVIVYKIIIFICYDSTGRNIGQFQLLRSSNNE